MHRDKIRYRRFRKAGLAAGLAGALLLAGCAKTAGKDEIGAGNTGGAEGNQTGAFSGNGKETLIIGNENTVTIEGEGAAADGANVTISAAGTYRLTGNIAEGGVTVDAGKEDEVFLVLDNVSIANSGYSAIYASQSGLLTIVLEDGSETRYLTEVRMSICRPGRTSRTQLFSVRTIWYLRGTACWKSAVII